MPGVKTTKYLNNILTVSKLVPLVLFIALGIFFLNGSNFTPFVPAHLEEGAFANAAITMFIVGTILADVPLLTIFNRDSILYSILRLIPAAGLAWGVSAALGLDAVATGIAVLMTGMPAGATTCHLLPPGTAAMRLLPPNSPCSPLLLSMFTILFLVPCCCRNREKMGYVKNEDHFSYPLFVILTYIDVSQFLCTIFR